jgi:hypothetical protein
MHWQLRFKSPNLEIREVWVNLQKSIHNSFFRNPQPHLDLQRIGVINRGLLVDKVTLHRKHPSHDSMCKQIRLTYVRSPRCWSDPRSQKRN